MEELSSVLNQTFTQVYPMLIQSTRVMNDKILQVKETRALSSDLEKEMVTFENQIAIQEKIFLSEVTSIILEVTNKFSFSLIQRCLQPYFDSNRFQSSLSDLSSRCKSSQ